MFDYVTMHESRDLASCCIHSTSFRFFSPQQRGSSPQIRFSGLSANDAHDGRFLVSFIKFSIKSCSKTFYSYFSTRDPQVQCVTCEPSASTPAPCRRAAPTTPISSHRVHRRRICSSDRRRIFCNLVLHRKSIDLLYCFRREAKLAQAMQRRLGKQSSSGAEREM